MKTERVGWFWSSILALCLGGYLAYSAEREGAQRRELEKEHEMIEQKLSILERYGIMAERATAVGEAHYRRLVEMHGLERQLYQHPQQKGLVEQLQKNEQDAQQQFSESMQQLRGYLKNIRR